MSLTYFWFILSYQLFLLTKKYNQGTNRSRIFRRFVWGRSDTTDTKIHLLHLTGQTWQRVCVCNNFSQIARWKLAVFTPINHIEVGRFVTMQMHLRETIWIVDGRWIVNHFAKCNFIWTIDFRLILCKNFLKFHPLRQHNSEGLMHL